MRGIAWTAALLSVIVAAPAYGAPGSPGAARVATVTLVIGHRVFPDFVDHQKVKLNQDFQVGDTDYTARIVQYVPDFAMDMNSRKILTRSPEPKNPAFKIIVKQKKVPQDTTWAMLHMLPHYTKKSMLAFRVDRIDFIGHAPIIRSDSTSQRPKAAPSAHPLPKSEKPTR